MSKPRYRWWGYVLNVIRAYPELEKKGSDITEQDCREYLAVFYAVQSTIDLPDGASRLQVVDLVYWHRSHTLEGAAQQVHWSYRTVRRKHTEFILLVAWHLGLYGGEMEDIGHGKDGLPV